MPQGAILSPMLFNICMHLLAQLTWSFGLECHQYADNTHFYLLLDSQANSAPVNVAKGLEAVVEWLRQS